MDENVTRILHVHSMRTERFEHNATALFLPASGTRREAA